MTYKPAQRCYVIHMRATSSKRSKGNKAMNTTPQQSRFEVMFDAINVHSTSKVADVINVLAAKAKRTKKEDFVLWVAKCVIDDREMVNA